MEQAEPRNAPRGECRATVCEELASHSHSLLALVHKLQNPSGASAAIDPVSSEKGVKAGRARVGVLSRMPNRAALPLDADEAAS